MTFIASIPNEVVVWSDIVRKPSDAALAVDATETFHAWRQQQEQAVAVFLDAMCATRERWIRKNSYYYRALYALIANYLPPDTSVCQVGCDAPNLLMALGARDAVGFCVTPTQQAACQGRDPSRTYLSLAALPTVARQFDYVVITSVGYWFDVQELFRDIAHLCHARTRLLVVNYNFLWEPLFLFGEKIGVRMPQPLQRQNMVPSHHVANLLGVSGYEMVQWHPNLLLPIHIPLVAWFANKFCSRLFPFRWFASTDLLVARPVRQATRPVTVAVVVPCKNECDNIEAIVRRMPLLAEGTEIVFVDDRSTDGTGAEMRRCAAAYPHKAIRVVEGPGVSKAEAVRAGCHAARGDIVAVLDADLAVAPEELPKCIQPLLDGTADFVNTVRFVYPQQDRAMRWLNVAGNRLFALLFSCIIRQRIGDTLCGTKVFWKVDYRSIDAFKDFWIWRDQWGDFEQLLGASKMGCKIVDVPVHYARRRHGETKMQRRFWNGWHMFKLCLAGLWKLRFA